jgi:hypothetical protein
MSDRVRIRFTLLILLGALAIVINPAESSNLRVDLALAETDPPGDRAAEADSLAGFLEDRNRAAETAFSSYSLDVVSLPDSVVDSLLKHYEETGEAPDFFTPAAPRLRAAGRIAAVRYNRVEGLNLMPGAILTLPTRPRLELYGAIGYGTASEEVTWEAGLRSRLMRGRLAPRLEIEYAENVRSYGSERIPGNSLFAFFLGEDSGDYLAYEGWSARFTVEPGPHEITLLYRDEDQKTIPRATKFNIVGGRDQFRPNPPIDDGEVRALSLGIVSRWYEGRLRARAGGTMAGGTLGGDHEYESIRISLEASRSLWRGDRLVVRVTEGLIDGEAPFQALHHLGGFRILRGYEVNEFPTRSSVHLAADYELGTNILKPIPLIGRQRIQLVPFYDAAAIFESQSREGARISHKDPIWKFAAGLGLQKNFLGIPGGPGQVRLDIGRRLDRESDAMTYRLLITAGPG